MKKITINLKAKIFIIIFLLALLDVASVNLISPTYCYHFNRPSLRQVFIDARFLNCNLQVFCFNSNCAKSPYYMYTPYYLFE